MYDGMNLYRALVAYSSNTTGDLHVCIPAVLGSDNVVPVSKIGRTPSGGMWSVPSVGSQVVVAVEDDRFSNVYLIDTSVYSPVTALETDVAAAETNIASLNTSVGSLNTSVTSLNTSVGSLNTSVTSLSSRVTTLEGVTPYTAATPMSIVSVVSSPYAVQTSDVGKLLQVNSTGAVTISIPATGFSTGVELYVASINTGKVTIGGAATINSSGGIKTLTGQYSTAALIFLGSYWLLFGDLG